MQVFRAGIFKQAKFMISTPQNVQGVFYQRESGMVSHEVVPIYTGFLSPHLEKKCWKAEHVLKMRVLKNGEPVQDETVLIICDRSYMPLDPLGILKPKDRENRKSLCDEGGTIHDQVLVDIGTQNDQPADVAQTVIIGSFIVIALSVIAKIFIH